MIINDVSVCVCVSPMQTWLATLFPVVAIDGSQSHLDPFDDNTNNNNRDIGGSGGGDISSGDGSEKENTLPL